jgi:hypothetical protein
VKAEAGDEAAARIPHELDVADESADADLSLEHVLEAHTAGEADVTVEFEDFAGTENTRTTEEDVEAEFVEDEEEPDEDVDVEVDLEPEPEPADDDAADEHADESDLEEVAPEEDEFSAGIYERPAAPAPREATEKPVKSEPRRAPRDEPDDVEKSEKRRPEKPGGIYDRPAPPAGRDAKEKADTAEPGEEPRRPNPRDFGWLPVDEEPDDGFSGGRGRRRGGRRPS